MSKLVIYYGSKNIIEKPIYMGGKAHNDYGFGFYCTEEKELAKEWSVTNDNDDAIANEYSIELDGLKILDLTDKKYSILNWISILLKYRTFDLSSEISKEAHDYLLKNFYIDVNNYDIVIGYHADDSYFSYARDFVNNTISVRQLSEAMKLGNLGKQVVIISKKAFNKLNFEGFENVNKAEYFAKRKLRDEKARSDYLNNARKSSILSNDIFIIDIMRKEINESDLFI